MQKDRNEKPQHTKEVWEEHQDAKQQRRMKRQRARQYYRRGRDKFSGEF
jgi:hypothetical protein